MEGYSVTEAASVLGVPTERVWELLARGILSGAPDGETGMRVFLQPRPAPVPPAIEEPRAPNGGARGPEVEASPFRELLTEFRNLTERYGQALLALGEARGEVASLRSRVDLLEARFDLRLPMSGPMPAPLPSAAGWANPQPLAPPEPEAPPSLAEADRKEALEAVEAPPRRKRGRGHRRATDDFAEALARAEDPSPAELPGAAEAAAAFAALREEETAVEPETERPAADVGLPRELPAAESMAVEPEQTPEPEAGPGATLAAEEQPAEAVVIAAREPVDIESGPEVATALDPAGEPEPAVEVAVEAEAPEVTWEEAAAAEASVGEPEREPTVAQAAEVEPEPGPSEAEPIPAEMAEREPRPTPEPTTAVEDGSDVELAVEDEPEPIAAAAPEEVALETAESAHAPEPEPVPEPGEASWDRERYSARIEEPDWIPEERVSVEGAESTADDVKAMAAGPADAATEEHETPPPSESVSPAATRRADEETVAWFERDLGLAPPWPQEDDPAAEIEVASTGARTTPVPEPADVPRPAQESRAATTTPSAIPPRTPSAIPPRTPPAVSVQPLTPPNPASRAYRRLRRIFPG